MSEQRKRTGVRGYIPTAALRPEVGPEFVLRRRGPYRPVVGEDHREKMMAYAAEQGIIASYPEAVVHYELTRRRLVDGIHYSFQSSMFGGRTELGGCVVDFLFLDRPLALRVQGTYFHLPFDRMGHGTGDEDQRLLIESRGLRCVDLWENEILDPEFLENWLRRNIDVFFAGMGDTYSG